MKSPRLVPFVLALVAAGSGPAPSADAQARASARILYSSDWSGTRQIYAIDPSGRAAPAQLTFGRATTCEIPHRVCGFAHPTPSPNGRRIVYSDECSTAVFVASADGRSRRKLGSRSGSCVYPGIRRPYAVAWSPDSRRIAYASDDGVHVADADGSADRTVARAGFGDEYQFVTWSPDGRSLALARGKEGTWGLDVVRLSTRTRLFLGASDTFTPGLAWSPNGRWIAYTRRDGLHVVRPNGSRVRRLSGRTGAWSPDGRLLAFVTKDGIGVANVASRAVRTIVVAAPSQLAWSPDGGVVAFEGKDGIGIVELPSMNVRLLSSDRATSGLLWSPDGRSLAYQPQAAAAAYWSGADVRLLKRSGASSIALAASGDYGGVISGVAWTRPPAGLRFRRPKPRTVAITSPTELTAPWTIERIAADGGRVAYLSCGHVFVWTPASGDVLQADPEASLSPRCSTPDNYVALWTYSVALSGDRVIRAERAGNMGQTLWLGGAALGEGAPRPFTLDRAYGAMGGAWQNALGYAVGSGPLLVYSQWNERAVTEAPYGIVTTSQTVRRVGSAGCPCPELGSSPGPFVPADVDGERIVVYGNNETLVLDRDGAQLASVPVSPAAAQLAGRDLVLIRRGELRRYDATSGALVRAWPLPDVSAGMYCGCAPRTSERPRLTLEDAARGLVAYVLDGQVHVLRLSDGADAVVASGSLARFLDAGLVYAEGPRLHLVRLDELPLP